MCVFQVATRDCELHELARERDIREAALRREAASTGRVLEAILRLATLSIYL